MRFLRRTPPDDRQWCTCLSGRHLDRQPTDNAAGQRERLFRRQPQDAASGRFHINPMWPMPCAGVYLGIAPILIGDYGTDVVNPAHRGDLGASGRRHGGGQGVATGHSGQHVEGGIARLYRNTRNSVERWSNEVTFSGSEHLGYTWPPSFSPNILNLESIDQQVISSHEHAPLPSL